MTLTTERASSYAKAPTRSLTATRPSSTTSAAEVIGEAEAAEGGTANRQVIKAAAPILLPKILHWGDIKFF